MYYGTSGTKSKNDLLIHGVHTTGRRSGGGGTSGGRIASEQEGRSCLGCPWIWEAQSSDPLHNNAPNIRRLAFDHAIRGSLEYLAYRQVYRHSSSTVREILAMRCKRKHG